MARWNLALTQDNNKFRNGFSPDVKQNNLWSPVALAIAADVTKGRGGSSDMAGAGCCAGKVSICFPVVGKAGVITRCRVGAMQTLAAISSSDF